MRYGWRWGQGWPTLRTAGLLSFAVGVGLVAVMPRSVAAAEDLTGVWLATSPRSVIRANRPELTRKAQADLDAFDPLDDPVIRCVVPGVPRSGLTIYPFEIVQTETMLVFLYEHFGMVRRIYLDGRALPDDLPPGRMGYSLGHWEDAELVIDTTRFAPALLGGDGLRQYGDMSVRERYRLLEGGQVLEADVTITAPTTFVAPWTRRFTWQVDPNGMIYEAVCDPADSRF